MCLVAAVHVIGEEMIQKKLNRITITLIGAGQPLGTSLGLTVGGLYLSENTWRWGFRIVYMINTIQLVITFFSLFLRKPTFCLSTLRRAGDWIGASVLSTAFTLVFTGLS